CARSVIPTFYFDYW
nr:immunoglobulin heavy chain junction region [Mus musculus]